MDRNLSESLVKEGFSSLREMIREQKGYKTLDDFTTKTTIMGSPAKEYISTKNPDFGYADFYKDGVRMAGTSDPDGYAFVSSDPVGPTDPPGGVNASFRPTPDFKAYTGSGRSTNQGGVKQAARMRGIKEQSRLPNDPDIMNAPVDDGGVRSKAVGIAKKAGTAGRQIGGRLGRGIRGLAGRIPTDFNRSPGGYKLPPSVLQDPRNPSPIMGKGRTK